MASLGRSVIACFRDEGSLRRALRELEALGISQRDAVRMTGRPRAGVSVRRTRLSAGPDVRFLLIPVSGEGAAKGVSLAMLRHSDGPVEVRDRNED
jgi:hypothetical protein